MNKLTIFSNYINHHQLPLCKEFVKLTNDTFNFVSQKAISEKRIAFGYKNISNDYDFVVKTYENNDELDRAYDLANNSEYIIFGSSNEDYLKERLSNNKITFKYSERFFREKLSLIGYLKGFRRVYINHGKYRNKNLYLLCNGAYVTYDFNRFGAYRNKTYKWGYFPETIKYSTEQILKNKNNKVIKILWAGRFLKLKHPEILLMLCEELLKNNYDFEIDVIGNGELEEEIKNSIREKHFEKNINLLGSMPPVEVRKYMEKANIFLFTSDKHEGWGAVLNEAMNSGCACIASHAIGSAGFLINNGVNGFIYRDDDFKDLYNKVVYLIDNREKTNEIGINAYKTISEMWNAEVAAKRFLELAECLKQGKDTPFIDGPCSKAYPIKDEDMYDYLVNNKKI